MWRTQLRKMRATRWWVSKDRLKDKWNLLMTNRFYNGDNNEKLSAREKQAEGWIKLTMVMREKTRCWWPESNWQWLWEIMRPPRNRQCCWWGRELAEGQDLDSDYRNGPGHSWMWRRMGLMGAPVWLVHECKWYTRGACEMRCMCRCARIEVHA